MNMRRHIVEGIILALCTLTGAGAAAADYLQALRASGYRVFSGDLNGDGRTDLLVQSSLALVPVPLDDDGSLSIVPIAPLAPAFVLLSGAGGTYSLVASPPASTINNSVWKGTVTSLAFGSVEGNAIESMLVQAASPGAPSFVVSISGTGSLRLLQQLNESDVGFDLGSAGTTAQLKDHNGDGRADLMVFWSGQLASVVLADASGQFHKLPAPPPPPPSPPPSSPPPPPPPPPPATCRAGLYTGGSSNGLDIQQELGATGGLVQVSFKAHVISDTLEISTPPGKVLASTYGPVTGEKALYFTHDPDAAGSSKVHLKVTGNADRNTIWELAVSCPGEAWPPPPQVGVLFGADEQPSSCGPWTCTYSCTGHWEFDQGGSLSGWFGYLKLVQGRTYTYTAKWVDATPLGKYCYVPVPYYSDPSGKHPLKTIGVNSLTIQMYGNGGGG